MAVQTPPYALQASSHSAALFRQTATAPLYLSGIAGSGELIVAAQSTPNMTVQVAAGRAWMVGTQVSAPSGFTWTTQGDYFGLNDASATLTIATANGSLPRIDVVYMAVNDAQYSGVTNNVVLGVVTGTPNASPTVPAAPNNAIALAQVRVNASVTSILNSNITDVRALAITYPASFLCTSTTRPANVWSGFQIWETDTGQSKVWDGINSIWRPTSAAAVCTSSTRPTSVPAGTVIFETDTSLTNVWTGSAWISAGTQTVTAAYLRQVTVQSGIAVTTWTNISFDAEDIDTRNGHSNTTNNSRYTVPAGQGGTYLIDAGVCFGAMTAGTELAIRVTKNGAVLPGGTGTLAPVGESAGSMITLGSKLFVLAAGDFLQIQGWTGTGGSTAVNPTDGTFPFFTILRVA